MSEQTPVQPTIDDLLSEFADQADTWFSERPFVQGFHKFVMEFFKPENLQKAEWPAFQELANQLHSLNSVALAKGNAFGRPNYPIEKYRESFLFLAHGSGSVEERMRSFMEDNEAYASKYLGKSVVSELIGQLFADQFVFMNRRDIEAAEFLGIHPNYPKGADFPARFTVFNAALEHVFHAYNRVVGNRVGAPIGLEVDQFLSWLYQTKINKAGSTSGNGQSLDQQIWVFAPGPQASFWDECLREGIAVMGWDELGPLDGYENQEQMRVKLKEYLQGEQTNNAKANWEFSHVMKDGDLILIKRGNRKILGAGIIRGNYRFDPTRKEYRHVRDVEWTHQGEWLVPEDGSFATKTLTNITRFKDWTAKILATVGIGGHEFKLAPTVNHYWLNCSPSIWRVSECKVGEEDTYTTHNEQGNKRQVYANFQAVKPGDLVVGYETSPIQKVTSVLEVTNGLHGEEEGELISFKVLKHLEEPRRLSDLRKNPALANCGPVQGNHQGSLFQLTKAEFEATLSLDVHVDTDGLGEVEIEMVEEYSIEDALEGLFIDEKTFRDWLRQWREGKNLILQGPPGVGKTFVARRLAYALMGFRDPKRVAMVQFHQSYGYEDFVQGYRPGVERFELRNGTFYEFCLKAKESPKDQPFVFIVDEINRGNLSRILGELLMLIEPDKRGESHALRLAYQAEGQTFFVPENVYILGMMNTADRSLAVVDYALRRRFRFAGLQPAFSSLQFREHLMESCGEDVMERILARVSRLNDAIGKDISNLGPGFCVGHSYFTRIKSMDDYQEVVQFQIAPLLREYWFDAPKKAEEWIQSLLGL